MFRFCLIDRPKNIITVHSSPTIFEQALLRTKTSFVGLVELQEDDGIWAEKVFAQNRYETVSFSLDKYRLALGLPKGAKPIRITDNDFDLSGYTEEQLYEIGGQLLHRLGKMGRNLLAAERRIGRRAGRMAMEAAGGVWAYAAKELSIERTTLRMRFRGYEYELKGIL